jgi:hypothetical protein
MHLTRCPKVVVISYTMLHHLRKTMLEQEWALLIVDESHHVRCSKNKSEPNEVQILIYLWSEWIFVCGRRFSMSHKCVHIPRTSLEYILLELMLLSGHCTWHRQIGIETSMLSFLLTDKSSSRCGRKGQAHSSSVWDTFSVQVVTFTMEAKWNRCIPIQYSFWIKLILIICFNWIMLLNSIF